MSAPDLDKNRNPLYLLEVFLELDPPRNCLSLNPGFVGHREVCNVVVSNIDPQS